MASGVEKALATAGVNAGKKVLGAERYEALVGWAHERVGDLKALAATVRGYFEKAKEMLQHFWDITFVPLLKKLQGLMEDVRRLKDRLTKVIGEQFERVKKLAAAAWTAIQANVIEPVWWPTPGMRSGPGGTICRMRRRGRSSDWAR
jgi:hypothetical protein